ncbi:carbohydrate ABC transporter permease [Paenibacillus piri]|uniref:Sugar ABC transporter permease n=1 Tax=Paenibacillus piri TaxID=2547395 RepID=A0A4R5KUT3_9BACL|nr:sugar ABC transporter permease [Paenibacillus piri]TDF98835.1 sugar ABC transporter permease [Paenibacillus piri]
MGIRFRWNRLLPYAMIFPNVLIYTLFILIPVLWVVYLSFTNFTILNPGRWIGLANYKVLLKDEIFHMALKNTILYWLFTVIPTMVIGLILAALLNLKLSAIAAYRAFIYLPGVISSVAVSMTWLWLLDPRHGPINLALEWMGLHGHDWLREPQTALPSIVIIGIWTGIGYAMILFLAGLQGIPDHLYEAAEIDGASSLRQFFHITVPLLRPVTFFLFITLTIRSFQVFDFVFILTNGGPANTSTTIVNEIVKASFQEYRMGYAAAISIVLLLITLVVTAINYTVGSKESDFD